MTKTPWFRYHPEPFKGRRPSLPVTHCKQATKPDYCPQKGPPFRKRLLFSGQECQLLVLLTQLPTDFGRIVQSVKPYSQNLPLLPLGPPGATPVVEQEIPQLDRGYCMAVRHRLISQASLPAFCRFLEGDVP